MAPDADTPLRPAPLTRRALLRRAVAASALATGGLGVYARCVEPHWLEVIHRSMPLEGLDSSLVGKRVVLLSDLHVGTIVSDDYLAGVVRRVAELAPDFLLVAGDWMTCRGSEQVAKVVATIRPAVEASRHAVGVLGNHDFGAHYRQYHAAAELCDRLGAIGVRMLRNESVELDGLQLAGAGDLWADECSPRLAVARLDPSRAAIALTHNPDAADRTGWGGFRGWVLAGHTHGGQCSIPGYGPPILPVHNKRYAAGHIALGEGRDLYVSRGVGYTRRVRFCARPEATVFTLARA